MTTETLTSTLPATATGAEAVIRTLEANDVDVLFGIPGVHTLALYDALRDSSIRHVLARHEQGVGFMTDGYARVSGKAGVALVITGPGVTNLATALGEAYTDSSPILAISSNVERAWIDDMRGNLHDLKDQLGVTAAVTKWNGRAMSASSAGSLVETAFWHLRTGRPRPVHVEFPLDVLDEPLGQETPVASIQPGRLAPGMAEINAAAEAIERSHRPVLYCGGGAVSSGASAAVTQLAERLGAPVITSIMGKGAIREDHPLSLGALWSNGNAVDEVLRQSDCLIVIGSKLGYQETGLNLPIPGTLIRIDIDPREMHLNARPDIAIEADARLSTEALLERLGDIDRGTTGFGADAITSARQRAEASAYGADRRALVDALRRAIPRDGILSTDMTQLAYVATYLYPVYEPRTFLFPMGYGTLGFALPAAIGAKIARPEATVVAMVGDGGFQYTMGELGCAVQERLGVPIVIFNDSTYSAVKSSQERTRGGRYIGVDLVNPDYVELARAYGIPGVRVETPDALEREVRLAADRDLPTIIDVPIPGWVSTPDH
ncbi:MAG: thiamine pyrophosphate-binding protein [Thermomicrobiales bacterium]|nr:thiamine pyrophosphate-binding protein [Thermomicrobiales bacterium]